MRIAVWFSQMGLPSVPFDLPYQARSPVLSKVVDYKTEEDILEEVKRIINEKQTNKFGLGQSLYYQMPLFCNPALVIPDWCWNMINDYYCAERYNIPIANDLYSASAWLIDCFDIIKQELYNIEKHIEIKNGR